MPPCDGGTRDGFFQHGYAGRLQMDSAKTRLRRKEPPAAPCGPVAPVGHLPLKARPVARGDVCPEGHSRAAVLSDSDTPPMSFYFIGNPDPENPYRWIYSTSTSSTPAIFNALHRAGFQVTLMKSTESVAPYLEELDISKRGAKREDLEAICAMADPGAVKPEVPKKPGGRLAR
jgi:hypothetical protein